MAATIASFKVDHFQFLNPEGQLVTDGQPIPALARDIKQLLSLYRLMTQVRVFDKKAVALQRTGKLGTYASCLGHEAAHVAIGSAMREEDCFAPMYREYGAQMYRGVKMSEILMYWGGDERGNNFSGPKHDFPWCVPIATQCLHAAGAALAYKLHHQPRVAVSVVGDGGSSKGDFLEAINAASAWKLPLVLVIVNNQWAISVPRSKQNTAATLAQKGIAGDLHSVQVDGNDIIAARYVMDKVIAAAREGKGASVVEMMTYRLSDHTTADDARRYRDQAEVDAAWKKEPLTRLRSYLMDQGFWDEVKEEELLAECADRVQAAVEDYQQRVGDQPQAVDEMFRYMYKDLPHNLEAQRELARRYPPRGGH
ncbi:MAG: pyruvate dehydrogenase (acetyl-transferring) E1 component subunit alpha [Wenzhouxiangellaceae bacterium]|nr:pyruvate dehydrogenase (acetyl-transferring) E1 component subunit alpha [Wenzhouxiangellaceae bacterium]